MSQANLDLMLDANRRFQAGDPAWVEIVHPEIEWDFSAYPLADLPNAGRGRDALLSEVMETYFSGWVDYEAEVRDAIDLGDHALIVLHESARLRDSEVRIEREVHHLWTVRDALWTRWRIFPDRESAIAAAREDDPEG